jgi:outer membrane protein
MIRKSILRSSIALAILLGAATPAFAQGIGKVGTVDMEKIFNEYYKTKKARARLKEVEEQAKTELEERMDAYKTILEDLKKIEQEASNEALSEDVKKEKINSYKQKAVEAKSLEKEIGEFRQTRQRQIQEQILRMRRGLLKEIMEKITEKVKVEKYDLVFDRTGPSSAGYPLVIYSREGLDFTDDIVQLVNKDAATAPADLPE